MGIRFPKDLHFSDHYFTNLYELRVYRNWRSWLELAGTLDLSDIKTFSVGNLRTFDDVICLPHFLTFP